MDISSSSVTGALKLVLQIVSSHKRPFLEVYHQVRNVFSPEYEYHIPRGADGSEEMVQKMRHQDVIIQFTLVNIGGERAENIKLSISGDLERNNPREDLGDKFKTVIPQIAPGQALFLFRFDGEDLEEYPEGGGKSLGIKEGSLKIIMEYDASKGFMNRLLSIPSKVRGRRRFKEVYVFMPQMVSGDLPPAEYMA